LLAVLLCVMLSINFVCQYHFIGFACWMCIQQRLCLMLWLHFAILTLLMSIQGDLRYVDNKQTPLLAASQAGSLPVVKMLLSKGAAIHDTDEKASSFAVLGMYVYQHCWSKVRNCTSRKHGSVLESICSCC